MIHDFWVFQYLWREGGREGEREGGREGGREEGREVNEQGEERRRNLTLSLASLSQQRGREGGKEGGREGEAPYLVRRGQQELIYRHLDLRINDQASGELHDGGVNLGREGGRVGRSYSPDMRKAAMICLSRQRGESHGGGTRGGKGGRQGGREGGRAYLRVFHQLGKENDGCFLNGRLDDHLGEESGDLGREGGREGG